MTQRLLPLLLIVFSALLYPSKAQENNPLFAEMENLSHSRFFSLMQANLYKKRNCTIFNDSLCIELAKKEQVYTLISSPEKKYNNPTTIYLTAELVWNGTFLAQRALFTFTQEVLTELILEEPSVELENYFTRKYNPPVQDSLTSIQFCYIMDEPKRIDIPYLRKTWSVTDYTLSLDKIPVLSPDTCMTSHYISIFKFSRKEEEQ